MIIIEKIVLTEYGNSLIQGAGDQLSIALGVYITLLIPCSIYLFIFGKQFYFLGVS